MYRYNAHGQPKHNPSGQDPQNTHANGVPNPIAQQGVQGQHAHPHSHAHGHPQVHPHAYAYPPHPHYSPMYGIPTPPGAAPYAPVYPADPSVYTHNMYNNNHQYQYTKPVNTSSPSSEGIPVKPSDGATSSPTAATTITTTGTTTATATAAQISPSVASGPSSTTTSSNVEKPVQGASSQNPESNTQRIQSISNTPATAAASTVPSSAAANTVSQGDASKSQSGALPTSAEAPSAPEPLSKSPEIGDRVSLITQKGVRYEGKLERIDVTQRSLVLVEVRCFGTEDRQVEEKCPAQDKVWKMVVFKGESITHISIIPNVPDDPAIISAEFDDPAISNAVQYEDQSSTGPSNQRTRSRKHPSQTHKIEMDGEYDFEAANKRYEEIRLRADDDLARLASAAADDGQEAGDGPDVPSATTKAYDKTKSFFDGLTTGHTSAGRYRQSNNRDTFGEAVTEYQSQRRRENAERRGGRQSHGNHYQRQQHTSGGAETAWRAESNQHSESGWRGDGTAKPRPRGGYRGGDHGRDNRRSHGNDYSQSSDYNSAYSGKRN